MDYGKILTLDLLFLWYIKISLKYFFFKLHLQLNPWSATQTIKQLTWDLERIFRLAFYSA